jgi:hypothetical protein
MHPTGKVTMNADANTQSGIDLLILRGPTLDAVVSAIARSAGIEPSAVKRPNEPYEKALRILDQPSWAVIYTYGAGDFAFKVDLDGTAPRDYCAIARGMAQTLNTAVAWPDESTLSATACVLCDAWGSERAIAIEDAAPGSVDGFVMRETT